MPKKPQHTCIDCGIPTWSTRCRRHGIQLARTFRRVEAVKQEPAWWMCDPAEFYRKARERATQMQDAMRPSYGPKEY